MTPRRKERPIIFSGPMVRAILDGRKTQTRRSVKPQGAIMRSEIMPSGVTAWRTDVSHAYGPSTVLTCPYGAPGDRLWVRESARLRSVGPKRGELSIVFKADAGMGGGGDVFDHILVDGQAQPYKATRWTPGIHMPRWASRILLEVTGVRVERLQDISEADAVVEGVESPPTPFPVWGMGGGSVLEADAQDAWIAKHGRWHRERYRTLWESINGAGSWEANPWVWVVEFRKTE